MSHRPVHRDPAPLTRNVDENTSAGEDIGPPVAATDPEDDTLTYSLDLDQRGPPSTLSPLRASCGPRAALDYEGKSSYLLRDRNRHGPLRRSTTPSTVTITVGNVEEAGTVRLSSLQPQVGFQLTATLDDLDDVVSGSATWLWAGSPNGSSSSWTLISGATSATYTPVAADVGRLPAGHCLLRPME